MDGTIGRAKKAFALAVLIVTVLAFTPAGWLGWTVDLSNIIRLPLTPFGDLVNTMVGWVQPTERVRLRFFDGEEELLAELERVRRLLDAEQLRVRELEQQLEQLQLVPLEGLDFPIRPLIARITSRDPRSRTGTVEINRGSRYGVTPGTIAVYGGVHLAGRVNDVSYHRSHVLPITSPAMELIDAVIMPSDRPDLSITDALPVQLEPVGDGTFLTSAPIDEPVVPGDIVRLVDRTWPGSAQAMVIGRVESARRMDEQTLRNRIVVRPFYELRQLAYVTLKIELDDEPGRRVR